MYCQNSEFKNEITKILEFKRNFIRHVGFAILNIKNLIPYSDSANSKTLRYKANSLKIFIHKNRCSSFNLGNLTSVRI